MDIPDILNRRKSLAAAASQQHYQQQLAQNPGSFGIPQHPSNMNGQGMPQHPSQQTQRYAPRSSQPLQPVMNMQDPMRYPSPTHMGQPMQMLQNGYAPQANMSPYPQNGYMENPTEAPPRPNQGDNKAFACSTCKKGFARRSDLARHGMI